MSQILPPILIALAATALLGVLLMLWSSLRALLAAASGVVTTSQSSPERERLLAEKKSLLNAIKDLEFERDVGKLSDDDFERLDARYRASAREVLRALEEQVGPHRERARSLIEARIGGGQAGATQAAAGEAKAATTVETRAADGSTAGGASASTGSALHACGASNDADAVFCKKCGERLQGSAS